MMESLMAEVQADIEALARRGYTLKKQEVVHGGVALIYSKHTDEGEILRMTYVCKDEMLSKSQLYFVLDCGYDKVLVKRVMS
jgi:hypothetical protein